MSPRVAWGAALVLGLGLDAAPQPPRFLQGREAHWEQAPPGFRGLVLARPGELLRVEVRGGSTPQLRWRGALGPGEGVLRLQVEGLGGLGGPMGAAGGRLQGDGGLSLVFEPLGPPLAGGQPGCFTLTWPRRSAGDGALRLAWSRTSGWVGLDVRGPGGDPDLRAQGLPLAYRDGRRGVLVEGCGLSGALEVRGAGLRTRLQPGPGGTVRALLRVGPGVGHLVLSAGRQVRRVSLRPMGEAAGKLAVLTEAPWGPGLDGALPGPATPIHADRLAELQAGRVVRVADPEAVNPDLVAALARRPVSLVATGPWPDRGPVEPTSPRALAGRPFLAQDPGTGRAMTLWSALDGRRDLEGAVLEALGRDPRGLWLLAASHQALEAWNREVASPQLEVLEGAPRTGAVLPAKLLESPTPASRPPGATGLLARVEALWALQPAGALPLQALQALWRKALLATGREEDPELQRQAQAQHLALQPAPSAGAVDVVNLLGWVRSGAVRIPAHLSLRGDQVRDPMGRRVPSRREADGSLQVWAEGVPPLGILRLRLEPGEAFGATRPLATPPEDPLEAAWPLEAIAADLSRAVPAPLFGSLSGVRLRLHALRPEGEPGLWRITLDNPGDQEGGLNLLEVHGRVLPARLEGPGSLDLRNLRVIVPPRRRTELVFRLGGAATGGPGRNT